tara:strand:- start:105 stop:515 length:411 start_codon:yes stop_codon:yes gene_type:complete
MKYLKIETPGVQQHPEGFKTSLNARDDASLDSPNQQVKLVPQDCPKFDACRAPICPLDPEMLDRTYLSGESVCHYLRLHAKTAICGQKHASIPKILGVRVALAYPKLVRRYSNLKNALERAARFPPKTIIAMKDDG